MMGKGTLVLLCFFYSFQVQAQFPIPVQLLPPVPPILTPDTVAAVEKQTAAKKAAEAKKKAEGQFKDKLLHATRVGFKNMLKTFLSQIAYETATFMASGGRGQSSLFNTKTVGKYFTDLGLNTALDFAQTISKDMMGFDICNPDPRLSINIAVGLGREIRPRKPACEWQKVKKNWEKLGERAGNFMKNKDNSALKYLAKSFSPQEGDIGIAMSAHQTMLNKVEQKKGEAALELSINNGLKNINEPAGRFIKTPATVLGWTSEEAIKSQNEEKKWFTDDIWADSLGVFTSTLFAKSMKNLANWIGSQFEDDVEEEELLMNFSADASTSGGITSAQARYASLNTVAFQTSTNIDLLSEFESCDTKISSINNCTLDTNFAQAIRGKMTIVEAIDKNLLNPNWPFGFSKVSPSEQVEPRYNEGYAYSNMRKLRLYRVLPLGWEIAATQIKRGLESGNNYRVHTLREVLDGFGGSASNPFYHLVDPNWVLKIPPQECAVQAPSALLEAESVRLDACADVKTCLKENENDESCATKYGYCTREKNVWRFNGDSCPARFSGCKVFENSSNDKAYPLIQETLSFDSCTASNAGCLWYSQQKDGEGNWYESDTALYRNYFNKYVSECDAEVAGCAQFIASKSGLGTNLVRNGSLEEIKDFIPENLDDTFKDTFVGWKDGIDYGWAVSDVVFGNIALKVDTTQTIRPATIIDTGYSLADRFFTLSFYAKNCQDADGTPGNGNESVFGISGGTEKSFVATDDQWQRYASTVYFPENTGQREIDFTIKAVSVNIPYDPADVNGKYCLIDGIQLEEAGAPSGYAEYGSKNIVYQPTSPDYLKCAGSPSDKPECAKYALVCSENEVGCNAYSPVSYQGSEIDGILSSSDFCSQQCVGYRTYKQGKNYFESEKFPVYFIASTATECTAVDNGCSEFTNLDELKKTGAEKREYYTFLRQCEKPSEGHGTTYYTWQGSEKTGYYLKNYSLVKGGSLALYESDEADESAMPPAYIGASGVGELQTTDLTAQLLSDCNETTYANGTAPSDCLQFYDTAGKIAYRRLPYTISISDDCHPYRRTRQITTEDECLGYTKSNGVGASWNKDRSGGTYYCDIERDEDCTQSGGTWNVGQTACVYQAIPNEGTQCEEAANSCREYKGNFSSNTRQAFFENFEYNPDISEWLYTENLGVTSEALAAGGHSLKVKAGSTDTSKNNRLFIPITTLIAKEGGEMNDAYMLSFIAKGNGNFKIGFYDMTAVDYIKTLNDKKFANFDVALTSDWKLYTLGPVILDQDIDETHDVYLHFAGLQGSGDPYYLDDISLTETTDIVFLRKDTWKTSAICDQNQFGVAAPQYQLGCESYIDSAGQQVSAKSFSNLCSSNKVGCSALIDTQNSRGPWQETYNAACKSDADSDGKPDTCWNKEGCACRVDTKEVCKISYGMDICRFYQSYESVDVKYQDSSTEVVSVDSFVYLVNDPEKSCAETAKGCTEMGQPNLSTATTDDFTTVNAMSTVYKINDPDRYGQTLCSKEYEMCQEYKNNGGSFYFKDPKDRVCVYKLISGGTESQWYKKYKTCRGGSGDQDGLICYGSKEEDACGANGGSCVEEECPIPSGTLSNVETQGWDSVYDIKNWEQFSFASGICVGVSDAKFGTNPQSCEVDADCETSEYCFHKWAYQCEAQYDLCSNFRDNYDNMLGYYYQDNETIDTRTCNGLTSQKNGCILFQNSNNKEIPAGPIQKLWSSKATYQQSIAANNEGVTPIDCMNKDNQDKCKPIKTSGGAYYSGFEPMGSCGGTGGDAGTKCSQNSDCDNARCKLESWGVCQFDSSNPGSINGTPCPYRADGSEVSCGNGSCVFPNDGNDLVKVRRDRVCGEWLDCVSQFRAEDAGGNKIDVCSQIQRCRTLKNGTTECEEYVSDYCEKDSDCYDPYGATSECDETKHTCKKVLLSTQSYQARDISWAGYDYAGYSLYEKYPIEELRQGTIGVCGSGKITCFSDSDCGSGGDCNDFFKCTPSLLSCFSDKDCRVSEVCKKQPDAGRCTNNGNNCLADVNCGTGGVCRKRVNEEWHLTYFDPANKKSLGIDAKTPDGKDVPATSHNELYPSVVPKSCRAFPESEAPFDSTVEGQQFTNVNYCREDNVVNPWGCECAYKKREASGMTLYTATRNSSIDYGLGLCVSADVETDIGKPCTRDDDCGTTNNGATCQLYDKTSTQYGWAGYCLEKDLSQITKINGVNYDSDYACLTWYPAGILRGEVDTFNYSVKAGYTLAENRKDYCAGRDHDTGPSEVDDPNTGERGKLSKDLSIYIEEDHREEDRDGGYDTEDDDQVHPEQAHYREDFFGSPDKIPKNGWSDVDRPDVSNCPSQGDGIDNGCYTWCAIPKQSLLGCYLVSDNEGVNGTNCDTDGQYNDNTQQGRVTYPWTGPKIYRQATAAIRFILQTGEAPVYADPLYYIAATNLCNVYESGDEYQVNEELNRIWLDANYRAFLEGEGTYRHNTEDLSDVWCDPKFGACIDLHEENYWDTDSGKEAGDKSSLCIPDGKNCFRFKANWHKEEETNFEVLESLEVWAVDNAGASFFAITGVHFYDKDYCSLPVLVIDENLNGPNVVANTNILWEKNNNGTGGFNYTTECKPYSAMSLGGNNKDMTHRVLALDTSMEKCVQDKYLVTWGTNDTTLSAGNDNIFKIYGKVWTGWSRVEKKDASDVDRNKDHIYYSPQPLVVTDLTYTLAKLNADVGPRVYAVLVDVGPPTVFKQGTARTMTIFGADDISDANNIVIENGGKKIDLSFFAYDPSGAFMPLRTIKVDWDVPDDNSPNGKTIQVFEGSYKNHKETCNQGSTTNFGDTSDACVNKPFSFSFVYECAGPGAPGWEAYSSTDVGENTTGTCVFLPRVQVTNNWGWCNSGGKTGLGNCAGAPYGSCYGGNEQAGWNNGDPDCNDDSTVAWAYLGRDTVSDSQNVMTTPQYIIVQPKSR